MMARKRQGKPGECFAFTWRRRVKGPGFAWLPAAQGRWLLVGPAQESLLAYEPLVEETGLFLTFAHLDGSQEAFVRFADTYGRLGTSHTFGPQRGEPLDEWQRHHRWMRFLVTLRSACLQDRPQLGRTVSWDGNAVVVRFPKIGTGATETWRHRGWLRLCPSSKQGLPLFQAGNLKGPARWFLGYAVDDWLRALERCRQPIAAQMVWSEADGWPQLVFGPCTLLGAMVCQLAAALHGAWPFQQCARCHKFFRLEPGVNRANRLTCSHTCKQYLYNRRVQRARELYQAGRTVRQIVEELQVKPRGNKTSAALVRAWIKKT
jgi:hypothetical protein